MAKSVPYSERKFDKKKAQDYNVAYQKANYDRINFLMPKGTKEKIAEKAEQENMTVSEWIRSAIDEKLNK